MASLVYSTPDRFEAYRAGKGLEERGARNEPETEARDMVLQRGGPKDHHLVTHRRRLYRQRRKRL